VRRGPAFTISSRPSRERTGSGLRARARRSPTPLIETCADLTIRRIYLPNNSWGSFSRCDHVALLATTPPAEAEPYPLDVSPALLDHFRDLADRPDRHIVVGHRIWQLRRTPSPTGSEDIPSRFRHYLRFASHELDPAGRAAGISPKGMA